MHEITKAISIPVDAKPLIFRVKREDERRVAEASGKGLNKPLSDTGALNDAFDYEIEE